MNGGASRRARIVGLIAAAIGLVWLNKTFGSPRSSLEVVVEVLKRSDLDIVVVSPGVVELRDERQIASEVTETVVKKRVTEGDAVAEGDILVEFSDTNAQLEYMQSQNEYRSAQSAYKKTARDYKVQRSLYRQQAIAKMEVEETARELGRAKMRLTLEEKRFALAKEKRGRVTVRAPIAGVVIKDSLQLQPAVKVGDPLFVIGDPSQLRARAQVDELDVARLSAGQEVHVLPEALPGESVPGTLESVAMKAKMEGFSKVDAIVAIRNDAKLGLRSNSTVRCRFVIDRLKGVLHVPMAALIERDGVFSVFVLSPRARLERRVVRPGARGEERVQILEGLQEGETILAQEATVFKPGDAVRVRR